jgi:hypothetical protein
MTAPTTPAEREQRIREAYLFIHQQAAIVRLERLLEAMRQKRDELESELPDDLPKWDIYEHGFIEGQRVILDIWRAMLCEQE